MSVGESDEVRWLAIDEAVRIEILAAKYAARGGTRLGLSAWVGWDRHALGDSPDPSFGPEHMAGWLARQIWCHGRGDDSEHVDRTPPIQHADRAIRGALERVHAVRGEEPPAGAST